jgi:hypothetical protein
MQRSNPEDQVQRRLQKSAHSRKEFRDLCKTHRPVPVRKPDGSLDWDWKKKSSQKKSSRKKNE